METKRIKLSDLVQNEGQVEGLPKNPRSWTREGVEQLAKSIKETPELLEARGLIVYPYGGKYLIIGGNMRYDALRSLKAKDAPCFVLPAEMGVDKLKELVIKDNGAFGSWDYDELANIWDDLALADWGVPVWTPEVGEVQTIKSQEEQGAEGFDKNAFDEGYEGQKLADRFIVPPFSVLDCTSGTWRERRDGWLAKTGNLSETRDTEFGRLGGSASENMVTSINAGTSNFDPVLAEVMFRWFAPEHGRILDPFGGEQTKGVVAGELGLDYSAVEIRPEQVELNRSKCAAYPGVKYYQGDSNHIDEIIDARGFDLCFTSPPYYDLEVYSREDMSALGTYEEFMAQYENIFRRCYEMLADDAFLVVKVGEIRDKATGVYRGFVSDNIDIMCRIGFKYYNEIILLQATGTAAMRANRYMTKRKVVKRHQNVLVFYKGNINALCARLPNLSWDEQEEESQESAPAPGETATITGKGFGRFFAEMAPIYGAFSAKEIPATLAGNKPQEFFLAHFGENLTPAVLALYKKATGKGE